MEEKWIMENIKWFLGGVLGLLTVWISIKKQWHELLSLPTTKKQNEIDFATQAQDYYNKTLDEIRKQIERDRESFNKDRQEYEAEILAKDKLLKESLGNEEKYKRLLEKHSAYIKKLEAKLIENNISFERDQYS